MEDLIAQLGEALHAAIDQVLADFAGGGGAQGGAPAVNINDLMAAQGGGMEQGGAE